VAKVRVEGIEDLRRVLDDTDTVSVPLGSVVPHGTILHVSAGDLVLSAGQWSADIRTRGIIDTRSIVLGTKLGPDSTLFSFRSGREVMPGEVYALVRGDAVDYRVTGKFRYAFIALSPDSLLQQGAEDALRLDKAFWERCRWFRAPQGVRDSIVQSIQKIVTHVSRSDVSVAGQALRQLRSELVEAFLRGVMLDEHMSNDHNALSSATIVHKVEDWVDGQSPETIQIADLCRALHLPRRTLQRAFTETLGVGPARYLTLKRLTAVRSALRRSDPTSITVTDVALRHGFWELGRFATDYRRVFGERPSQTLTRGMR
jgi:AraC family ethanolamine operon transcriptional activator